MKRAICGVLVVGALGVALAQERPNFAGRWILAGADSQPAQPLIVHQTETALEVENWSRRGPSSGTYEWPTTPAPTAIGEASVSWNGTTLVVVVPAARSPARPATVATRTESWSVDNTGKLTVVIELTSKQGLRLIDRFTYSRSDRR
jgi:hypothetical protein